MIGDSADTESEASVPVQPVTRENWSQFAGQLVEFEMRMRLGPNQIRRGYIFRWADDGVYVFNEADGQSFRIVTWKLISAVVV